MLFNLLPKVHKVHDTKLPLGFPGRPIISGCNSLTENISFHIDTILKPYMECLPSYVKDTSDFIKKLHSLQDLTTESYLVTLDVSSLYSNIPHDDGIKAYNYFLRKNN